MKKLFTLMALVALVGCAEKKPLTPEEQWKGYCTNTITKEAAIEHANKIEDEITKTFILDIIEQVYAFPIDEISKDPEASRNQFKQKITEKCIATPHDKMPNYKPF